jgi:anti-sigma regulatory factor (Ser/Thr protein kinase)
MPERDHGPSAVATLLAAPAERLDRPVHDRDLLRSRAGQLLESQQRDPADSWPLRSYLQLGALPGAVPCARLHAKLVLWEWGLDRLVETSELLVSEIVTNAVRASTRPANGPGGEQQVSGLPAVWLWLATNRRDVLIQVWDGNDEIPARQDRGLEAEGGRGLLLVERLSAQWGTYTPEGWSGKVVWGIVAEAAAVRVALTASA